MHIKAVENSTILRKSHERLREGRRISAYDEMFQKSRNLTRGLTWSTFSSEEGGLLSILEFRTDIENLNQNKCSTLSVEHGRNGSILAACFLAV